MLCLILLGNSKTRNYNFSDNGSYFRKVSQLVTVRYSFFKDKIHVYRARVISCEKERKT